LEPASSESYYMFPQILPGGKAVLFENRMPDPDTDSIEAFSFAERRRKTVVRGVANPYYLPSGHLIYTNKATLFAIAFDGNKLETRGTAVPILDNVAYIPLTGSADLGFAQSGALVYRRGGAADASQVIQLLDATGKKQPLLAKPGAYSEFGISPDGKRLALIETRDVWVYDMQRDAMTRLTFGGTSFFPVWSPDGRYVVFSDNMRLGMYWTRADGASQPQPLTQSQNPQIASSFTPDGQRLAYFENSTGKYQIWTLPLEVQDGQLKAGKPEQFLKDQFNDVDPAFLPDGHWLAYISNASGKNEVYVRAFPPPASGQGGQWQISNSGVTAAPRGSRNGRELIYKAGDQLMVVSYAVNGDSFVAEKPRVWIDKLGVIAGWDLVPDGKRVAVITPVPGAEAAKPEHEVTILFNFFDELRRRVPVGGK
jgi:eukaryotic-like serine/threonine-protein kinase